MVAAIVDAGLLVALIDRAETQRRWAIDQLKDLEAPLLLCEVVLTETLYVLKNLPEAHDPLFELFEDGKLSMAFSFEEHVGPCAA